MDKPYRYRLRPAYGSDELLLEFLLDTADMKFISDLFDALVSLKPGVESVEDCWLNDEVTWQVNSEKGRFSLSKDSWDFAFIIAQQNQACILAIHQLLNNNTLFAKEEVDFEKYRNPKKLT